MADGSATTGVARDKQRYTRRLLNCSGSLLVGTRALDCEVLDLSAGGAKVATADALSVSSSVVLCVEDLAQFEGMVAWRDGHTLGIEFSQDPERVSAAIPDLLRRLEELADKREHLRSAVLWSADVYCGPRADKCEILNVSAGGAKLRVAGVFPRGTRIELRSVRFGELAGEVVWQRGPNVGIRFLDDPERVTALLAPSVPHIREPEGG